MRLHRNLVFAVIDALDLIFEEGAYADKVIAQVLKRDKRWGARDRGFIAETVYEMVRWKRLYAEIARVKQPFSRQDLFRMFAVWAVLKGVNLPDWEQFKGTPTRRIKGSFDALSKERKFKESVPDWLDELGVQALGEAVWSREINALNREAQVVLRTNILKTSKKNLQNQLAEEKISTKPIGKYPDALVLDKRSNVFMTKAFKQGLFEIQDASSQLVAPMLQVAPGQRVIDACAGAGGKTLHLACLMENKGQLIAMDVYQGKLNELKRRAKRNNAHNIETRLITSAKVVKRLKHKADRVLIDAPCTGLGVLRRNPDAKWKLQPGFIAEITETQQDLLKQYSTMVKPLGKMVYATCSILPQENEKQVSAFLSSPAGQDFILEEELRVSPAKSGFDGFYIARLRRK